MTHHYAPRRAPVAEEPEPCAAGYDSELQPYLAYFDALLQEPRMDGWADKQAWWLRVTGQEMDAPQNGGRR